MKKDLEFKISSGLKDIIGKELITNDFIAIFELVKNSYDAKAKEVKIAFLNIKKSTSDTPPRVLIIDDGEGMSYDDLVHKFLFVGYSEKKFFEEKLEKSRDFRDRIHKRRIFAGAKGVGRFSCDRLGPTLKLYTKIAEEDTIHILEIDWTDFEDDQETEFQTIKVTYTESKELTINGYQVGDFKSGTILEIYPLYEAWEREKLVRLKRHLQRLINPIQVDESDVFSILLETGEYLEEDKKYSSKKQEWNVINGEISNFVFEKLGIRTTEISSEIDSQGTGITTELVDRGNFIFKIKEKNEYTKLKNVKVKIFYLNRPAKSTFTKTMGIQPVNFGSIFLYKNGVRIQPYGEPGEDWLSLEQRKLQGMQRYLATREIIGRVELNGYQPDFKEVTSRDGGVVKTPQYYDLKDFIIKKALRKLERFIVEALDWERIEDEDTIREKSLRLVNLLAGQIKDPNKEIEFNENLLQLVEKRESDKISQYLKNLESLEKHITSPTVKQQMRTQVKALRKVSTDLQRETKKAEEESSKLKVELEEQKKKILFLENVNPEAIDITSIVHTIGISTFAILENITYMTRRIDKLKTAEILEKLEKIRFHADKIEARSNMITHADFDMSASTLESVDIVEYISQYLEKVSTPIEKGLKIEIEKNEVEFSRSFKHLELSVVIDNLLDNSKKAKASKILFKFQKKDGKLLLTVCDNGRGIHDSVKERIFNLGYSTTGGSGIGMYHIKNIMPKLGASIKFAGNTIIDGYPGATFEVLFNE